MKRKKKRDEMIEKAKKSKKKIFPEEFLTPYEIY
jgi:hypothetical protein